MKNLILATILAASIAAPADAKLTYSKWHKRVTWPVRIITVLVCGPFAIPAMLIEREDVKRYFTPDRILEATP